MPVNFHIGASTTSMSWLGSMPWPSLDDERKLALGSLMVMISNFRTIGNLLLSGVLERHPSLQVVSVESGLGWIPFLLEGLDYELGACAPHIAEHLSIKPSEYFRRQVHACYWFEQQHLHGAIEALGPDNIMFETDFPHPTCLYPDPLARAVEPLAHLEPTVAPQAAERERSPALPDTAARRPGPALAHQVAAVDHDLLAGDVRALVTGQVHDGVGDIERRSAMAHRDSAAELVDARLLLLGRQAISLACGHRRPHESR